VADAGKVKHLLEKLEQAEALATATEKRRVELSDAYQTALAAAQAAHDEHRKAKEALKTALEL